jgi:VanZ family protein
LTRYHGRTRIHPIQLQIDCIVNLQGQYFAGLALPEKTISTHFQLLFPLVSTPKMFCKYWLPVLLWMMVIFVASQDAHSSEHSTRLIEPLLLWLSPHPNQSWIGILNHLFRKAGHLTEYAILALLLWRAICNTRVGRQSTTQPRQSLWEQWRWAEAGLSLSIVFLYAATDEFHQMFVPTRTPMLSDVLIDTCGGAVGLLALTLWVFSHRWEKQEKRIPDHRNSDSEEKSAKTTPLF